MQGWSDNAKLAVAVVADNTKEEVVVVVAAIYNNDHPLSRT